MSQLGLGLGLTRGGGVPFNPLSLDPYLLFDTRSSMIGTLENPTLDLDPADPETLDVITATRSGVATYTDANGVIQTASPDTVRVDYTQGEELTPTVYQHFGQTNFDDPAWQKTVTSITADDALAPDGTATADRMVIPPTANSQSSRLTEESNITSGTTVTISFYAKADGSINPLVLFANGSVFARILFNLQSETSSFVDGALSITHSIEEAANGFYRCSATFTSAGIGSISIRNATAGDGVSSLLLWGPQLEEGTTASDFVANTTGSPKFITGATYGPRVPMILVEPSSENLLPYSEDFSNAGWTKQYDVVVTSSSVTSPDGTTNAFKITGLESTDGDVGLIERVGASASTTYTFSAYLKALDNDDVGKKVRIRLKRNGGALVTSNQQVVLSSEWVRHSVSITLLSDNTGVDSTITKDNSSPTVERADECLIWGAQLEESSVPTSYIPALSGSTVTRAADDLVISGSDFTDFFSTTENTFYCEFDPRPSDETRFLLCSQATSARFIYQPPSNNSWYIYDGTSSSVFGTESSTGLQRAAATFDGTSKEASLNGGGENTSSHNGNLLNVPTELRIGKAYYGGGYLNGHIKRVIWWPYSSDRL